MRPFEQRQSTRKKPKSKIKSMSQNVKLVSILDVNLLKLLLLDLFFGTSKVITSFFMKTWNTFFLGSGSTLIKVCDFDLC
jgi:hypothetical protein